mmetsp:Transcript_42617/g.66750  ORF Transcript_42617/g.66750 Transcript_42617/m.66750 type:complete len:291 (+) Transcript_42617:88-960(+)|eukprot:CAMPEP_0184291066 /NCGR_PEP_ID=MMETSP1049-20130417/3168_1 /TAXON_ID=77928 /ORGANISM="Proteomonas sulcata, Strain CCMP704" /LENGTH=290 /DNA_ID=CAMNT_0026598385 /DNA_START=96 /DNA_END=968 /DNA_ORIENTATION=-
MRSAIQALRCYGAEILRNPKPSVKIALSHQAAAEWKSVRSSAPQPLRPSPHPAINPLPDYPARPVRPKLLEELNSKTIKALSPQPSQEVVIVHALAHIELGAVDNYWDTIARFNPEEYELPPAYYDDLVQVADDEAHHFQWLQAALERCNSGYGDLPAHKGLLHHAHNTRSELLSRLAIIPLVQEARGLDAGPRLVHKLSSLGAKESMKAVEQIVKEEEGHVRVGIRWFSHLCERSGLDPIETFHKLVLQHFPKGLPGPFQEEARTRAGMASSFYTPLEIKSKPTARDPN